MNEQPTALKITYRPVDDLIPYARNARVHSERQINQIAASIREFGFTVPVLLDGENGIIAGHGRVEAARKLAMDSVPCIDLEHLSETQKRAYILADNKLALNAGWDDELLGIELDSLAEAGFDSELSGFSFAEIEGLKGAWEPDWEKVNEVKEDLPAMRAKVVVTCREVDAVDVLSTVERACKESGIEGIDVRKA